MRSNMLHGSETWPVRKENEVALQQAEMRMVRWMCGIKLQGSVPNNGLRVKTRNRLHSLGTTANWLRWYEHVLRKEDDWVKKCMEYEVEGARLRGRPKKTWRDCCKRPSGS